MSGEGASPCRTCGASVPIEHSRCSRCGTSRTTGFMADVPTVPGSPLVRAPKRRRISSHDLVPVSLRQEYEQIQKEKASRTVATDLAYRQKQLLSALTGAALTAFPVAIPTFLFMPLRSDALLVFFLDLLVGALAGSVLLRIGGGLFRGLFVFALGFGLSLWAKMRLGYPIEHQPVATAVLASAAALSVLVAAVVGVALDEHSERL